MTQSPYPKKAFLFSLFLHVFILIILICSFEFSSPMLVVSNEKSDTKIINAVAMTEESKPMPPVKVAEVKPEVKPVIQQPIPVLSKPDSEMKTSPKPAPANAAPRAQSPVKKIIIPDRSKKLTENVQQDFPRQELTQKLLADLEDEISKQKKAKQKALKKAFNQELKTQSARALQQFMKEQKQVVGARSQQTQGIVDKYKALILQAIGQQWVMPSHVDKHLYCELLIRLAPGGIVLDVQIIKGSGDVALDRSARAAVFKASPLPVPDDIYSFEPFRQFVLKVKPENAIENTDHGFWIG